MSICCKSGVTFMHISTEQILVNRSADAKNQCSLLYLLLCRHWPVVVAAVADLPRSVAGGSCASAAGVGFPLALADVSAKCKPEEAYPALVMGTQVCGVASHSFYDGNLSA